MSTVGSRSRPNNLGSYYREIETCSQPVFNVVGAGVFPGESLISTALVLKERFPDALVFGFDTFSGFP